MNFMKKNKLNKIIDSSRDERNHLWTSFIVLLSGSLTVIIQYGILSMNGLFAIIGLVFSFLLFFLYLKKSIQIDNFINKLEG